MSQTYNCSLITLDDADTLMEWASDVLSSAKRIVETGSKSLMWDHGLSVNTLNTTKTACDYLTRTLRPVLHDAVGPMGYNLWFRMVSVPGGEDQLWLCAMAGSNHPVAKHMAGHLPAAEYPLAQFAPLGKTTQKYRTELFSAKNELSLTPVCELAPILHKGFLIRARATMERLDEVYEYLDSLSSDEKSKLRDSVFDLFNPFSELAILPEDQLGGTLTNFLDPEWRGDIESEMQSLQDAVAKGGNP